MLYKRKNPATSTADGDDPWSHFLHLNYMMWRLKTLCQENINHDWMSANSGGHIISSTRECREKCHRSHQSVCSNVCSRPCPHQYCSVGTPDTAPLTRHCSRATVSPGINHNFYYPLICNHSSSFYENKGKMNWNKNWKLLCRISEKITENWETDTLLMLQVAKKIFWIHIASFYHGF